MATMSSPRIALLLVIQVAALSCTEAPTPLTGAELVARAAGCYRLARSGAWPDSSFAPIGALFATFHLSPRPLSREHPELHPVDGMRHSQYDSLGMRLWMWSLTPSEDTVRVNVGNGFGGVGLEMTSSRDRTDWDARVVGFGDVGPPFERFLGMARVLPIACSDTGKSVAPVA